MKQIVGLFLFILSSIVNTAYAACSVSALPNFEFGLEVESFMAQSQMLTTNSYADIDCNRSLELGLLPRANLRVQAAQSVNGFVMRNILGDEVAYQISPDPNFSVALVTVGDEVMVTDANLLSIVSGGNLRLPLWARTNTANLSEGLYTDSILLHFRGRFCDLSVTTICLNPEYLDIQVSVQLQLGIEKACVIDVPDTLDLGQAADVQDVSVTDLPISVKCTTRQNFQISAGLGLHAAQNRRLANGEGSFIDYEIWQPNNAERLSSETPLAGNGTGFFQTFNAQVEVIDNGTIPEVGAYSDQVVVTVSF
ncbi:spore coat protein U-like protein [Idiomarina fontislapidosi]|uniref:spore coat protein U domain-containing protein n=1 Tax=Idiomarina fontislapidosi TaxID=263723 RepID=UPI000D8E1DF7|nr:spore coat protein U domain-containing protein [Idiomarina fontislapidosi]PYE31811.1 spore coat protein U-like protein [Idiomarina fontislapidosi]